MLASQFVFSFPVRFAVPGSPFPVRRSMFGCGSGFGFRFGFEFAVENIARRTPNLRTWNEPRKLNTN
jgi:hypothetical protein